MFKTENSTDDIICPQSENDYIINHKYHCYSTFKQDCECESKCNVQFPRKSLDSNNIQDAIRKGRVVEKKSGT